MTHTTAQGDAAFIQGEALGTEGLSPVGPATEEEPLAAAGTFFDPTAPGAGEPADLTEFGIGEAPAPTAPTTIDSVAAEEKTIENQQILSEISANLEKAKQQALKIEAGITSLAEREKIAEDLAAEETLKTFDELVKQSAPMTGVQVDSPEATTLKAQLESARTGSADELSLIKSKLDTLAVKVDADTANTIASLKGIYESRRQQQIQTNAQRIATLGVLGIVSGRTRFAPEIQFGILTEQERKSIQALASLDAQEAQLISQANAANTAQQFELLDRRILAIQDNRNAQVEIATNLYNLAVSEEKRIADATEAERLDQENSILLIAPAILDQIGLDGIGTEEGNALILKTAQEMGLNPLELSGVISSIADERRADLDEVKEVRGVIVKEVGQQLLINPITGETIQTFGPAKVEKGSDINSFASSFPSLDKQDVINATSLVVDRFGKRAIDTMLPLVLSRMSDGVSLDDIDDEIRLSEVSTEFTGSFKDAFFSLTRTGFTQFQRNENKEELDRLLQDGDTAGARDFVIGLARDGGTSSQKEAFDGNLNTVDALESLRQDLRAYIQAGGNTNIFTGLTDAALEAVGTTLDPARAEIANRIGLTLVAYRKAVSGAAFTESEAEAYERLFPSTGRTEVLNEAKIGALITELTRNRDNFVRSRMGSTNFENIFGEGVISGVSAEDKQRTYSTVRLKNDEGEIFDVANVTQAELDEAIKEGWFLVSLE